MARTPPFIPPLAPDPAFQAHVADIFRSVFLEPDALDTKTKWLIGCALDAGLGGAAGARMMAEFARENGATEPEILSVLRVGFAQAAFNRLGNALVAAPVDKSARPKQAPPYADAWPFDPEFQQRLVDLHRAAFDEVDALDPKVKRLIALALEIAAVNPRNVHTMARMAREAGATEPEIFSVLRIGFAQAGFGRLVGGLAALDRSAVPAAAAS